MHIICKNLLKCEDVLYVSLIFQFPQDVNWFEIFHPRNFRDKELLASAHQQKCLYANHANSRMF
jgi:hypothetical protein